MSRFLRLKNEEEYRRLQRKPVTTEVKAAIVAAGWKPVRERKEGYHRILARQIQRAALPVPVIEYSFDCQLDGAGRGWRFDLCWVELRIALEVDGGAHGVSRQLNSDIEKYQAAFRLNYRILRVSPEQVKNGEALRLVREVLR